MIIYINGRGMNAPELKAYISELEAENAELRAKVESANRQIAEYKRLLKMAAKIAKNLPCDDDNCGECIHNDNGYVCSEYECFEWRYADEALALIREDGDTNG